MKKVLLIVLLATLSANPCLAATTIVNSKHDMIAQGYATPQESAPTEICIFCHTPHGAQVNVTQAPLWNNTPIADVNTPYTSATTDFQGSVASIGQTDARLCLACHDSGVALPTNLPNVGYFDLGPKDMPVDALSAVLGQNMSNDHPIGMELGSNPETDDKQGGIRSIGEITGPLYFNEDVFFAPNNTMWCSSCHNVHDSTNIPFLRKSNYGSALCKSCHKR